MNDNNTLADDLQERIRELEAQLERCRAANVYDGNAHRRVSELEAALREAIEYIELDSEHPDMRYSKALLTDMETKGDASGG